jgi:aryl-alcohol dehydrogenase-like predicted oxidoreductase
MQTRKLGRTGLDVSVLGFGCGAVGGLMVRGAPKDQERAIARARGLGVTYYDTAPLYGDGASETNLGRVLKVLKPKGIVVGSKVRVPAEAKGRIGAFIARSLEESLARLQLGRLDLFQLHNTITAAGQGEALTPAEVEGEVLPAFQKLREAGKIGHIGFTAVGDTPALRRLVESGRFEVAQVVYNALSPGAGQTLPKGFPAQDYDRLLERAAAAGMGTIAIRVLAGGALSGSEERHPLNMQSVAPIGSGADYAADAASARRLQALVTEGHASSLIEVGWRFVVSRPAVSTALLGLATIDELEAAAAAVAKGPLSVAALARLAEIHKDLAR